MDFRVEDSVCSIWGSVTPMGSDCCIAIMGGSAPHVGTTVMAVPRESLTGEGMSATVSCLNRTGHMDDVFATAVAKQVAASRNCVVACSCGIHIDGASPEAVQHITGLTQCVAQEVMSLLDGSAE